MATNMIVNPTLEPTVSFAGLTLVRGTSVEGDTIVFSGGTFPDAELTVEPAIEEGKTYRFAAEVVVTQGTLGVIPPGGSFTPLDANGVARFTALESGNKIQIRGFSNTFARVRAFDLTD